MSRFWSNGLVLLGFLTACSVNDAIRVADVELRFSGAASCRPADPVDLVVVEALGDFAPSDARTIEILRPSEEPGMVDRFPFETAALVVTATARQWEGVGIRFAQGDETQGPMLLLPAAQECALGDPALALADARLMPRPDGGALIVAGSPSGAASRQVLVLGPGELLADRGDELRAARLAASVASEGEVFVVVGGAAQEAGAAHDTFEVMDGSGAHLRMGSLVEARRDAAAMGIGGGEVLVVGGRRGAGEPVLASVERIDVASGQSTIAAEMPIRRAGMSLVQTDDGAILALGGVADGGNPVGDIVAYDAEDDRWELLAAARLPALPDTAGVALPGGRIAVVASSVPGRSSSIVRVLRRVPPTIAPIPIVEYDDVEFEAPALVGVRGTALPDGRVLITGRDEEGRSRAFALDVGRGLAEELDVSDTPDSVVTLGDGVVLSTSPRGASMRRVIARTLFHQPPATLLADDLVLDAAGRFDVAGTTLRALVDGARADLATLRFADFRIEFSATGTIELLLRPAESTPIRVVATESEVGPALCTIARGTGRMSVTRHGDELTVTSSADERTCRVDGLGERVGVGFRLGADALLENIAVRRE